MLQINYNNYRNETVYMCRKIDIRTQANIYKGYVSQKFFCYLLFQEVDSWLFYISNISFCSRLFAKDILALANSLGR